MIYLVAAFDLRGSHMAAWTSYEASVLQSLALHGGELLERLRSVDDAHEFHVIRFPSAEQYEAYLADPARLEAQPLLRLARVGRRVYHCRDISR